jgi:hypothetical protein
MTPLKNLSILILAVTLAGCAARPKITYDYDDNADFNSYKTFILGQRTSLNLKPLDSTRFVNALARALMVKGLKSAKKADLIISVKRDEEEAKSRAQVGIGMSQQTRHTGINIGGAIPIRLHATTQTITIDFREASSHRLIWQSHASNTYKNYLTAPEKEKMYYNLFITVLKSYPPKTKK